MLSHVQSLKELYRVGSTLYRKPADPSFCMKLFLISSSVIFTLMTGGIIFGFPAIESTLLINERAFSSHCEKQDTVMPCGGQLSSSLFVVTIATSSVTLFSLPVGLFLDAFGPRLTSSLGATVFCGGLFALSLASTVSESLYLCGFLALALGGTAISTSVSNFSALSHENSSGILSIQSGAYQASSIVFVLWSMSANRLSLSLSQICTLYMVVPAVILIASILTFPDEAYGTHEGPGQRGEPHRVWLVRRVLASQRKPLLSSLEDPDPSIVPLLDPDDNIPHPAELYNVDVWSQLSSMSFVWSALFVGSFTVMTNLYLVTVRDQLLKEAGRQMEAAMAADYATKFTALLSPMLSIGGVAGSPVISWIVSRYGLPVTYTIQAFLSVFFIVFTIPGLTPLNWKVVGFLALGVNRSVSFGFLYSYLAEIFGFRNYGTVVGSSMLLGSVLYPVQYVFPRAVSRLFGSSYMWPNIALLAFQVSFFVLFLRHMVKAVFCNVFFRPALPEIQSCLPSHLPTK